MNQNQNLLPARYKTLGWILVIFLAINFATRIGLMLFEQDASLATPTLILEIFSIGLLHDLAAATYVLVPFALLALLFGNRPWQRRLYAIIVSALVAGSVFGFLFTALAEGTFWNEFSSRFNFIAVDYLVYTREVLGNIWQSYPVTWLLLGIGLLALGIFWLIRKPFWQAAQGEAGSFGKRLALSLIIFALPVFSFWVVNDHFREPFEKPAARELALNGYYEFMRAFRANDLDYFRFYPSLPSQEAAAQLQAQLKQGQAEIQFIAGGIPTKHVVTPANPPIKKNIILVSIESLGADYVESFGGKRGLTPRLDQLAKESMVFNQLYATGLRTVRGLEAITLSIPPTPGHAVPVRKVNTGLQSLGSVLKASGYKTFYVYGGYSYFDNMENFFSGNGYTVIDRTNVKPEDIHHETIWGIADEDILHHAIKVMSEQSANGQPVFMHIMTTSNHRPYTYPEGRIDIPSGTGRDGAVKYTDWALGNFVDEARKQAWFNETIFVFVADHTSNGRGRTDLPPENYRIPLLIWSPNFIQPQAFNDLASQIDVAPTILGLLNIPYTSEFFGQDIRQAAHQYPRAFMANYLTVGYMQNGKIVELRPKQPPELVDAQSGKAVDSDDKQSLINAALAYYQGAAEALRQLAGK
ncbi:LTA synthase family protein [Thiolinea disciformis]|uniref:LTA synthase family protein n=1 Tax=Thiolinea disciformis TaxID=125614 RepID=UPI00036B30D0|nr:alkaline phosphatase family protein [Thiolinea disciformis]